MIVQEGGIEATVPLLSSSSSFPDEDQVAGG